MATVLEALQNAHYNISSEYGMEFQIKIGKEQLKNAVTILEKGYGLDQDVEELIDEHGDIDKVPSFYK